MRNIKAAALAALFLIATIGVAEAVVTYGMSLYGDLKYPPNFTHFDYVNPDAPKGGTMRLSSLGTFDTLNPFVVKGVPAAGISQIFDTLMTRSEDEASSDYPLIAESADLAPDRASVVYTLNKAARFQDGTPITPADVVWSFETLRDKGAPTYRFYYGDVTKVEAVGDHAVRFTFKNGDNRELPAILSEMPVLSKAYWSGRDFEKTTLDPPIGSGPYKIESVDPGRSITYRRDPNYWAKDLPVNKGRFNVDVIRYDYYRDATVALEAFKGGNFDLHLESSAKDWATAYDVPEVRDGRIVKESIPNQRPAGMQAFAMNLRRPLFQDRRVREALGLAFDFEWSNQALFYGQYTRTRSYFDNSELAARGLPDAAELGVLEPLRGKLPEEVFTREFTVPKTDGSGNARDNLRRAAELLRDAGWSVQNGKLVKDGQPFAFEVLLDNPQFERVVLPYAKNLEKLGITASVRTVDTSQYRRRVDGFDFDMIVASFPESDSPGNEQREFWGSEAAKREGSRNVIGIADPAIDALIDQLIASPDRKSLVTHTRALDRALQWGYYVVPNWYYGGDRIAYWNQFGKPTVVPKDGVQIDAWWIDPAKAAALGSRTGAKK